MERPRYLTEEEERLLAIPYTKALFRAIRSTASSRFRAVSLTERNFNDVRMRPGELADGTWVGKRWHGEMPKAAKEGTEDMKLEARVLLRYDNGNRQILKQFEATLLLMDRLAHCTRRVR